MSTASKHVPTLALNYSLPRYTRLLSFLSTASSPTPISLVGPPEIYRQPAATPPKKSDTPTKKNDTPAKKSDSFMDLLLAFMGLTKNGSPGNPCLDFLFHVVPDTPPETLTQRLELAWNHDPLKALKLLCNLRGVRGTGKSDKEGGYTAALWLHENHPKTLALNVDSFAGFGYSKDLVEILFHLLEGPDARKAAQEAKRAKREHVAWKFGNKRKEPDEQYGRRLIMSQEDDELGLSHGQKRIQRAKNAIDKFNTDPDFKFLHDCVSDHFAQRLKSDMEMLKSGDLFNISLAAKWCPRPGSSYDTYTLLCETIAKKVFPRDEYPEYEGVEEAHYAYRVRDRLRKQVLVPLCKTRSDWGSIPYDRVKFYKHDKERFVKLYLEKVKNGDAKIDAGALLPHEIIKALNDDDDNGQVAELQWKSMVDEMAKKGKLNNCLAVSDVSSTMGGTPMEVSVALGLLVSELNEEPWKGKVITFSEYPKLQTVVGNSLKEKTEFVRKKTLECWMNTDFETVFDVLLQVAVDGKLKPEQMIKKLFVFSDMEFNEASRVPWEFDYWMIVKKFKWKGYGECVPEIVFWNLRNSKATPVPSNQPRVALVNGFSNFLMTLFLEGGGVMDPGAVMEAAISGKEYQKLQVFD